LIPRSSSIKKEGQEGFFFVFIYHEVVD
jgi:hypothetical protein